MKYRSKTEEDVAKLLKSLGVSFQYEPHQIPYIIQHNYTPDFLLPNGIFLEVKGYFSPRDRRKLIAVKENNEGVDIRMVFQAPYNKLNKRSKTTYATWCDKHEIKWCAFHSIPMEWLT